MQFQFWSYDENNNPIISARATVSPNGNINWLGPENEVKSWVTFLKELKSYALADISSDARFDISNLEHWKLLPDILQGGYHWVIRTE